MARCTSCNQVMAPGVGCTVRYWTLTTGHQIDRIRRDKPGDCPDCGAPDGGYHHPGCAVEIIPKGVPLDSEPCA